MIIDTRLRYPKPTLAKALNLWVDLAAPVHVVFDYLSMADRLNLWWATECYAERRPGGKLEFFWAGENSRSGRAIFRQFEPPHRLVLEWTHSDEDAILGDGSDQRGMLWPAITTYELSQLDGTFTRLYVHDFGINASPDYAELYEATCQGWLDSLERLRRSIEHGRRKSQSSS